MTHDYGLCSIHCGLPSVKYGLRWRIVACYLGQLGFGVTAEFRMNYQISVMVMPEAGWCIGQVAVWLGENSNSQVDA